MSSPWSNVLLPKIRRIMPSVIAQEIVSVQPMSLPKDLAILSSSVVIHKRNATNSDGVRFRFDPITGQDEINHFLMIKVSSFGENDWFKPYHDVGQLVLNIKGYAEKSVEEFINLCLDELRDRIDDLTIGESFNLKGGLKILEEKQQWFECIKVKNQKDSTTSPQSSMIKEGEFSA